MYFDKNGVGEYFNSFPRYPPHKIVHFLRSHAKGWQYNHMEVQELYTTACGQFVVFYIYQKRLGVTLEVILRKYFSTHNKLRNDWLVRDFVKLHYHHDAKVMDLISLDQIKGASIKSCLLFGGAAIQFIYLRLCITRCPMGH